MTRQILQIAATSGGEFNDETESVFALCDDGTVWEVVLEARSTRRWSRLPDIPQDEAEDRR